jgi:hypothetical protein
LEDVYYFVVGTQMEFQAFINNEDALNDVINSLKHVEIDTSRPSAEGVHIKEK